MAPSKTPFSMGDLFSYGFKKGITKVEAEKQQKRAFKKDKEDEAAAKEQQEDAKARAPKKRGPGRPRKAPELRKRRRHAAGSSKKGRRSKRLLSAVILGLCPILTTLCIMSSQTCTSKMSFSCSFSP